MKSKQYKLFNLLLNISPIVATWIIYSYFEKGCQKKCTRQSQMVLWVVFSSLFFKGLWKNGKMGHGYMSASAEGKQKK